MTCAFGFLVVIMIIFHDGICYYILEYYFGYHATFGLLVVSMIIFMMLVDVLLLGVLFSEMMFTGGSYPNSFILVIGVVGLLFSDSS